jgi:uncharacterized protein (DUF1778 family)
MAFKAKTENVNVRLSPEDKLAIERAATKAGMTVSEYIRACTLAMMVTEFDSHALKMLVAGVSDAVTELAGKMKLQRKMTA